MSLPDHLMAKMKAQKLVVRGPRRGYSWEGCYVVGMRERETTGAGGIRVLQGPVLYIGPALRDEDGTWAVEKHETIPGPGATDFRSTYATVEEAVDQVLHYFRTRDLDAREGTDIP